MDSIFEFLANGGHTSINTLLLILLSIIAWFGKRSLEDMTGGITKLVEKLEAHIGDDNKIQLEITNRLSRIEGKVEKEVL